MTDLAFELFSRQGIRGNHRAVADFQLGTVLLRQVEVHDQVGHFRDGDQNLALADVDAGLHIQPAPAVVRVAVDHDAVHRGDQHHLGHVFLVTVELLIGTPQPPPQVFDRFDLLDHLGFGRNLRLAQIQFRLFQRVQQPGHLARMVVAAEHLAVVLRDRELVFRLVDLGLRGF